jgi:hypothetical protein
MGTWGPGNFDNDGARDYLAAHSLRLFDRVIELLQHPRGHEYDDEEIDELFVTIEVIIALDGKGMITACPDPDVLQKLFGPYLQRWADYQVSAAGELWPERRNVIEESFAKLHSIASDTGPAGLGHRLGLIDAIMSQGKGHGDEVQ